MLMALHPTRPAFSDSASEETRFFNLIFRSWNKEIRISIWTHYDLTMSCCNAILSYGFHEWYRPALVRVCCQIKVWWWGGTLHPTTLIWNLLGNLLFTIPSISLAFLQYFYQCSISISLSDWSQMTRWQVPLWSDTQLAWVRIRQFVIYDLTAWKPLGILILGSRPDYRSLILKPAVK